MNPTWLIDPFQRTVAAADTAAATPAFIAADTLGWTTLWASRDGESALLIRYDDRGLLKERARQAFFRLPALYRGVFPGRAALEAAGELPERLQQMIASDASVLAQVEFLSRTAAELVLAPHDW